jgi:integrase
VERYKAWRMSTRTIHGRRPRPATVNRELACPKEMWNVARKGLVDLKAGVPAENPVSAIKFFDEQNIRNRVLTPEEFERMVEFSPDYLKPILLCAYHMGMRKAEILNLTWDRVDLKVRFIRLKATDTKTKEARHIPIDHELRDMWYNLPIALDSFGGRAVCIHTAGEARAVHSGDLQPCVPGRGACRCRR